MKMNKVIITLSILTLSFVLSSCSNDNNNKIPFTSGVMVTSVSTDGDYTVTSNLGRQLILWNIKDKTKKIISTDANIYSAYFIKNTDDFIWQNDKTNTVYVENVKGEILKSFNPGFPTYGEVMTSDLKNYFASDVKWNVYKITDNSKQIIKQGFDGFLGTGKLLNLSLSNLNNFLVTSGYAGNEGDDLPLSKGYTARDINPQIPPKANFSLLNGVALWRVQSGKPLYKLQGNVAKTYATISPDGKYVVSGDENVKVLVWNANTGKLITKAKVLGNLKKLKDGNVILEKKGFPTPPEDFTKQSFIYAVETLKFIDKDHYLRFPNQNPYAILYKVTNPIPLKYLPLGKKPWPSVNDYVLDQSIDTSPQAHILVMGMETGSGIIVYKYVPKTQTLKKIWVAKGPPVTYITDKQATADETP